MSKKTVSTTQQSNFKGFSPSNYTQTPDIFFDEIMTTLNLSETRVLLFIIRRTFGFKKDSDEISLRQMISGVITRDGRRLDKGTGLSKKSLLPALRSLEERGFIIRSRNRSTKRGDEWTTYSLNIRHSATPGEESTPRGRGRKFPSQDTVKQETVKNSNSKNVKKEIKRGGGLKRISELIKPATAIATKSSTDALERAITPRDIQTTSRENASPQKPYNHPYKANRNERLTAVIKEFTQEFGDTQHERENIKQIHNIYEVIKVRGITVTDLIDQMFRAKGITREKKGKFTSSKMAYLFTVLRNTNGVAQPP